MAQWVAAGCKRNALRARGTSDDGGWQDPCLATGPATETDPEVLTTMRDADELIDAALEAAVALPSPPEFRAWYRAYRAGHAGEEAVKRAFRCVWWGLANGRADDFTRLLANAEVRASALKLDELVAWAQAAAARAVLELIRSRRLGSTAAAQEQRTRAGAIATAALRFAEAAPGREIRAALVAVPLR